MGKRIWEPAGRGRYRNIETREVVSRRERQQRIAMSRRIGTRRYQSMLGDFKEKKAKQAGFKSFAAAKAKQPKRFGGDFRRRAEFKEIVEGLRGTRATDRRSAERKMRLLERLGRHVSRSWQFYLDTGSIPELDVEDAA